MTDLVLGIRLTADGKDLVGAVKVSANEIDKMGAATKRAASEAEKLNIQQKGLSDRLNDTTQAQLNANYHSWKAAEAWRAQHQAVAGASNEIQKILNRYDPLGTKLRQLQSDFAALDKAIAAGATGGTSDLALDKAMRSMNAEIVKTKALMEAAGGAIDSGGVSMTSLGLNTQYARRELMMLGREVMTGDFSQMPRTFGSLVAHSKLLSIALHPVTLGVIALGAGAVSVGLLAVHTEQTARAMNSLQTQFTATGREGLFPTSQLKGFIDDLARMPGQTRESATATISALASVPNMSAPLFEQLVSMVGDFAVATGRKAPDAMKELAAAFTDPVGQAVKLHNELGILTGAQILHIESLFNQGEALEATKIVLDAVTERTKKLASDGLTPLQKAVNDLGIEWDLLKEKMAGTPNSGVTRYFAGLTTKLTAFVSAMNSGDMANAILKFAQLGGGGGLTKGLVNLIPDFPTSAPGARSAAGSIGGLVPQRTAQDIQREIDAAVSAAAKYAGQSKTLSDLQSALIRNDKALKDAAAGSKEELVLAQAHMDIEKKIADIKYSMGADGRKSAAEAKKIQDQSVKGYVDMAEAIVKADFEATAEIAKQQIQAAKEEEKRQQDNVKGYVAMAEAIVQADFSEAQQLSRDQIAAANRTAQAEKRILDERAREQKRCAQEVERLIGDGIMRGFERGADVAENFRDTLVNMFKTLVLRPVINFIVSPISGAITAALGGMGLSGTANASTGAAGAASSVSTLSSLGNMFSGGASAATGMANGVFQDIGVKLGSQWIADIGNYGFGLPFISGLVMAASGNVAGGIGSTLGGIAGSYFGPIGTVVGSTLGGMIGSMFGGGEERKAEYLGSYASGTVSRSGIRGGEYHTLMGTAPNDYWAGGVNAPLPAASVDAVNKAINEVFTSLEKQAKALGISTASIADVSVQIANSGKGVEQDLADALAKTSDTVALKLMPNLEALRQGTESLTETFVRVTNAQIEYNAQIATQKRQMEIQLMELQGDAVGALAAKREDELKALDPTLVALQKQIYAAQDLAKAAETAATSTGALADALVATETAVDAQINASRTASQSARQAADAYRQVNAALGDAVRQLRGGALSPLLPAQKLAEARAQLDAVYGQAATGDAAALAKLPQMATDFLTASRDYNASSAAYTADFDMVMKLLGQAQVASTAMVNWEEYHATLLETQTGVLEAIKAQLALPSPDAAILTQQMGMLSTIAGLLQEQTTQIVSGNGTQAVLMHDQTGKIILANALTVDQTGQVVIGNSWLGTQTQQLTLGNALVVDQTGKIALGNSLVGTQTGQIITGNATQDVIKNITALNTSYSEQMLAELVTGSGLQSSSLEALVAGNAKIADLLGQMVGYQNQSAMDAWTASFDAAVKQIYAETGTYKVAYQTYDYEAEEYVTSYKDKFDLAAFDAAIAAWKSAHPIPQFASGGVASGWSMVGELGPELVHFGAPGRVYTADQTSAALGAGVGKEDVARLEKLMAETNAILARLVDAQNRGTVSIATAVEDSAQTIGRTVARAAEAGIRA